MRLSTFCLLAAVLALSVPFLPVGYAEDSAVAIEEIVVTARKRTESLQDVPVSIARSH